MGGRGALTPLAVVLYRDSALRREALAGAPGDPARYSLYGLDELVAAGARAVHTLETAAAPAARHRLAGRLLNAWARRSGGYGGNFAAVLAMRREIARADVVYSTVDTLGLPLVLLRRRRLVRRTPVVYVSIGLLERMERVGSERVLETYRQAVGAVDLVIAYGHAEAEELRGWLAPLPAPPPVRFVPFGVDTTVFAPRAVAPTVDVLSVGADPRRDWALLQRVAERTPELSYAVVAAPEQRAALLAAPRNVTVDVGLPLQQVRDRLTTARVVALPVVDNAYSGGTTTLLQAMAAGRPVVVSGTRAIAEGYGLVDGENCRLVPPGELEALERAIVQLAGDPDGAAALGARARAHVVAELGWERYAAAVVDAVLGVARAQPTA